MFGRFLSALRRHPPVVLIACVGSALAVGAHLVVSQYVAAEARNRFEIPATDQARLITESFARYQGEVESLRAFYDASTFVDRNEFAIFAGSVVSRFAGIQALEWIPRVRAEDRATYTQRARSEGLEHFEISERSPDRALVRAGDRDEYFPVYYLAPMMGNEAAVGFDLGSNPARRRALQKARDTGRMTLTERITLVQEEETQGGVLAILPIYLGGGIPATIESRRSALTGFVLGVFRIGDAVGRVVGPAETPRDLDVYLFDLNAEGEKRLLHFESVGDHDGHLHQVSEADVRNGQYVASEFRVADRSWAVVLRPHADPLAAFDVAAPLIAGGGIIFLTIMFSLFVVGARSRTSDIALQVDERTLALRQSEAQMRLVADSVPALIAFVDAERRFRFVNEVATRWYNKPISEILGKIPEEVHSREAHSMIAPYVERVYRGRDSLSRQASLTETDRPATSN